MSRVFGKNIDNLPLSATVPDPLTTGEIIVTTLSGVATINGLPYPPGGGGNISQWSLCGAVSTINASGNNIIGVNQLAVGTNVLSGAVNIVGNTTISGNLTVTTLSSTQFNNLSAYTYGLNLSLAAGTANDVQFTDGSGNFQGNNSFTYIPMWIAPGFPGYSLGDIVSYAGQIFSCGPLVPNTTGQGPYGGFIGLYWTLIGPGASVNISDDLYAGRLSVGTYTQSGSLDVSGSAYITGTLVAATLSSAQFNNLSSYVYTISGGQTWSQFPALQNVNMSGFNLSGLGFSNIRLGWQAGTSNQGNNAIALGRNAGTSNQGTNALALGFSAGNISQGTSAIAIGTTAGQSNQAANTIAIGNTAGQSNQAANTIAIGNSAGNISQGTSAIAVGLNAGQSNQLANAIAIGTNTGLSDQGASAIAIGTTAGRSNQAANTIAIGNSAGNISQGTSAIAIGLNAGLSNQGINSMAFGRNSGSSNQGTSAVAIGNNAGNLSQGSSSIAIGFNAGSSNQSTNSIAIGTSAGAVSQAANSIILSATGNALNSTTSGFFVDPVRSLSATALLGYNSVTHEIIYNTTFSASSNGYVQLGSSLQQWGSANITANPTVVTFPRAFGGIPWSIVGSSYTGTGTYTNNVGTITASNFNINGYLSNGGATTLSAQWFAVGPA